MIKPTLEEYVERYTTVLAFSGKFLERKFKYIKILNLLIY